MRSSDLKSRHPALVGYSEVVPLSGFSGAEVALLRTAAGNLFVRKAGSSDKTNLVLQRQARRQQWLRTAVAGSADVPEVLAEGHIDGFYYFDMSFIASSDAASLLAVATFDEVKNFAERIERLMATLAQTSPEPDEIQPPTKQALVNKLDEIAARTAGRFSNVLEPLRQIATQLDTLTGVENGTATASHGDLTFENILIGKKGQLWLIDTIDSPVSHYWIDWSKLFQECEGRWHLHRGRQISTGVTWWLRNRWMLAANRLAPSYSSRHYLLLALTFARILPYATSNEDTAYLVDRVARFSSAALTIQGTSK